MFPRCFPCVFVVMNNMVFCIFTKTCVFNSPKIDLCRHVFAEFRLLAWFVARYLTKINVSNCSFYESLWQDKSIGINTNSDSLLTQKLRLNNTGEKAPNLTSFGFTSIFNISCVKNSCLIFMPVSSHATPHMVRNYLLWSKCSSLHSIENTARYLRCK